MMADPQVGINVVYQGQWLPGGIGGTSVVPHILGGLLAATGVMLGNILPTLWASQTDFVDITSGDNGAYEAAVGPDPCSGIGRVVGDNVAALFAPAPAT